MNTTPVGYIRVKNLKRFQHYKKRCPPWIKLHYELLDDYGFGRLRDASKLHLIGIWLLASRCENLVIADPAWIARRIGATDPIDLDALVNAGFLERCSERPEPAGDLLAACAQSADPETETETETEKMAADAAPPKPKAAKATRQASGPHHEFIAHFIASWGRRFAPAEYQFQDGKDGAAAKKILQAFAGDLETAKARANSYIASDDPLVIKKGHTIAMMACDINGHINGGAQRGARVNGHQRANAGAMPERAFGSREEH